MKKDSIIAIIGLGYVGLPLAVAFASKYQVIGFDIKTKRVEELQRANDTTLEVTNKELKNSLISNTRNGLTITSVVHDIKKANVYIITVPTPINDQRQPLLTPLKKACETVASVLKKGDVVIIESTVYPGATEEFCVPIFESSSDLIFNRDFFVGYSPERINPGDKKHTVTKILKVTSGSTPEAAKFIDKLYASIITAGTYLAPSIKVAEAAKVIENSQRDINIAFVNELSKIFRLLNIDTEEVLTAAATKWNFLKFSPGLVGGHCIGVDPYYLAQKAKDVGYNPEIILAGRKMNDSMGSYVAQETVKLMIDKGISIKGSNTLVLGITFKENCPDIRNSRVIDIIREFKTYKVNIDVYDPWADIDTVKQEYNLNLINNASLLKRNYDAIVLAVSHKEFLSLDLEKLISVTGVIFDVKSFYPKSNTDSRL
ncbi:MAG: nucleotide sugar dehydrogenase [Flavobacteriaceae bacterium]|nr:nucleotide sugar dehydrogenase [Flavobacteriaceae bacterium]